MNKNAETKGLVQVYTGNGKGKTTAALGLALRVSGQGMKVTMIQFLKGGEPAGEHLFTANYPSFEIVRLNENSCFTQNNEELKKTAADTLAFAAKTLAENKYDIVILDEVLMAVKNGHLTSAQVLKLIDIKPEATGLVLTGRGATEDVIARADLVTEMALVKHPFERGIPARKGIEY
ncbi:cob(I)yrinic acid a,c-diamide adenosyltransferase [Chloroflexota bacterium]